MSIRRFVCPLFGVILLSSVGFGDNRSLSTLSVSVQQESALSVGTGAVTVKIRLNSGNAAWLWLGDDCSQRQGGVRVLSSGEYTFAKDELREGAIEHGRYCLLSDDGKLRNSVEANR